MKTELDDYKDRIKCTIETWISQATDARKAELEKRNYLVASAFDNQIDAWREVLINFFPQF